MSRPKTPKSKSRSVGPTEVKSVKSCTCGSLKSTPDKSAATQRRVEDPKETPEKDQPWSIWVWSEEGQMCYRGRKDSKGEWEYEFASLPKEKERPYTPLREEPIEYLIEELKIIWEPRLVEIPGESVIKADATVAPQKDKDGAVKAAKVEVVTEKSPVKEKEAKASEEEDKESSACSMKKSKKHVKHERHERSRKERPEERRGRQLERRHFSPRCGKT